MGRPPLFSDPPEVNVTVRLRLPYTWPEFWSFTLKVTVTPTGYCPRDNCPMIVPKWTRNATTFAVPGVRGTTCCSFVAVPDAGVITTSYWPPVRRARTGAGCGGVGVFVNDGGVLPRMIVLNATCVEPAGGVTVMLK